MLSRPHVMPVSIRSLSTAVVFIAAAATSGALSAEEQTGEQIYRQLCASCHGPAGEGVEDQYAEPLIGDKSVAELTQLITETMPADDPEKCVGPDAEKVAAYIHDAFYSPIAQARNKPAELELSRLTVRQYQQAVSDLFGSFGGAAKWDGERGLRAEYFDSRRFRDEQQIVERRDPHVDFDAARPGALPDRPAVAEKPRRRRDQNRNEEEDSLSAKWEGSVLAWETGDYEFLVETPNAARLWVNGDETPLIDAWVKSGDQTEYRESVRLLGGRPYRLRLEFMKTGGEKSASIALKWKRPHHAVEVIPERNLSPHWAPEVLIVETSFPPDDRSSGYERGTAISKEWDQATTYAALEVAAKVLRNLNRLADTKGDAPDRAERLREFARQLATRAFRRPLSDAEQRFFVDQQFEEAPNLETAVKRVVLLVLKSPRFLYREVGFGTFDDHDVAAWLSFGLWDSLPDQPLRDAAANGRLQTPEHIRRQAERMTADVRTRAKVREFLHQWLQVDRMHDLSKDGELFPEFNEAVASDLRTSLDLFLEDVVWGEASDYRQLLLADSIYLNGRLAKLYGVDLPADAPFQKVSFDPQRRAGVLSHPYLMAGFAYYGTSSPIHRGVFVSRSVLGRTIKPPPEAFAPLAPDLHPGLNTRERVALQTSSATCMSCHRMINPLGFSLEHFDAIGRYRTEEKDRPIDAAGQYITRSGELARFTGVRGLAEFLAQSEETHEAFLKQMFQHMLKQPLQAFGTEHRAELQQSFTGRNFSIRELIAEVAARSAVEARRIAAETAQQAAK